MDKFAWAKSTYSSGQGDNCVEVARNIPGTVAVRDSWDQDGPKLRFGADTWRQFIKEVKER